jgi:hypothetical protein
VSRHPARLALASRDDEVHGLEVKVVGRREQALAHEQVGRLERAGHTLVNRKRRAHRANFEQVRVVAYLAELHEDVDDAEIPAAQELLARVRARHELVVEEPLALREAAVDNMLELAGQLGLDLGLEATQDERSQQRVQLGDCFDHVVVHRLARLDSLVHRV